MKTENYYDEILLRIKDLISKENNKEAMKVLNVELSMPYIPQKYEEQFQNLYEQLFLATVKSVKSRGKLSPEDVVELLNTGDPIEESMAVDALHEVNIRQIQNELREWIETKGDDKQVGKAFIIETMIEQQVDIEIRLNGATINPSKTKSILENPIVVKTFDLIEGHVEKEPQIKDVVFSELKRLLLISYPYIPNDPEALSKGITQVIRHMFDAKVELTEYEKEIFNKLNGQK